ncbi:MAG: O-antigen ligase family protein [Polaribacter sp.]|jgi:O-antigen ligase
MEKIKKKENSIITIAFGFLFGLMLFPSNIKSVLIIIVGIIVLLSFCRNKFNFDKRYFISNTIYFLILLLTLWYTEDLSTAWLKVQTMLSLLAFPLFISLINANDRKTLIKNTYIYLWIYIIGVVLYNTISFLWFYSNIPNYSFLGMSYHLKNFIMNNIGKYGIHPIYMSIHCGLAVLFSLNLFLTLKKRFLKFVLLLLNIILFFFLLIYARKGPIIAFFLTLITFLFMEYKKYFKYNLLIVFGLILIFSLIPTTRNRFLELSKVEKTAVDESSSSNIRFTIYKNSYYLVKDAPFFGYGIGDYQHELNQSYRNNAPFLLDKVYNSHNQYLGFLLIGGIVLLLAFLFYFSNKFIVAYQTKNTLLIIVLVFYGIVMLFENILERENGVIFFALFINFFSLKKVEK